MMNASIKSALLNPKSSLFHIKSAFFHSTTVLERGRRNPWTEYDVLLFIVHMQRYNSNKNRSFCEDDDDDDVESIFRASFGDRFFFWSFVNEDYPNSRNSSRYSNRYKASWKRRHCEEDEYDDYEYEHQYRSNRDTKKPELASERIALGLSASGPLKLEDVKNAYRSCALKWHPDRHVGSSKADAEEKFKHCTAAYQSLCDKLAIN
ncbi:DnaJ-like protein subfamily B member 6 [Bienertia sinuspersici]